MNSGYGLRTLTRESPRFAPLSYHGGAVWPHDTAIVVAGLARCGAHEAAASFIDGVLAASTAFEGRLPELYGGGQRDDGPLIPYPAACRPQAWSAASAVSFVQSLLGLVPDAPAGKLRVSPLHAPIIGPLDVRGLRIGAEDVAVRTDRSGNVVVDGPSWLQVKTG